MTEDIIMDRIFKYFNTECQDDIDLEEWITGFNVILKGNVQTGCKIININMLPFKYSRLSLRTDAVLLQHL